MLAPYAMHDSSLGCPLVPQGDAAAGLARTYLLLSAWCWPASFVSMALRGFLLGCGEILMFVLMGLAPETYYILYLLGY